MLSLVQAGPNLCAIQAAATGEALFSPAIAARLIGFFRDLSSIGSASAARVFPELTDREREVLQLIAQGRSNDEIAARLDISLKTVRNHVSNIFDELQVATRAQAIVRAREAGLS
jgi:DNA-binding NarL/FixJ family response regulator